jgi:hypothetical protein
MYTQIVGKVRLALTPIEREWANAPLYVTARGLTTSAIPYGPRVLQIDFDFISHTVDINVSDGQTRSLALIPARSVADFFEEFMASLRSLGIDARIHPVPVEVPNPIPFAEDRIHASYDPECVHRFLVILTRIYPIFLEHRAPFDGRHTPVSFFWGTFDLAYARFSGRPAQAPSNANRIMRIAMDAEEIAVGFWPGDERYPDPAFFCYAYPKPPGIENASIQPRSAFWSEPMGEFLLRYDNVRLSASPRETIREFLTSTYDACAKLAKWGHVEPEELEPELALLRR